MKISHSATYCKGNAFKITIIGIVVIATALAWAQTTYKITIIGDSTVCNYTSSYYPQTGWGQIIGNFFTTGSVIINNKAIGGRSSRSFYEEGRWASIVPTLSSGEYVLIQFGHNDRDYTHAERYTDTTQYKEYLRKYVNESRSKGAIPVLVSPMNMNAWNGTTVREVFCEGANNYRGAMINIANELKVPFIDLEKKTVELQKRVGQTYAAQFVYLGLDSAEYPSSGQYSSGVSDGTHFQEMGAYFMAKFVCEGIRELNSNADMAKLASLLKPLYKVIVSQNKNNTGLITESGNTFPQGASITLKVKPKTGETFKGWLDASGKTVATTKIFTFTMDSADISYTAQFSGGTAVFPGQHPEVTVNRVSFRSGEMIVNSKPGSLIMVELFSMDGRKVYNKSISQSSSAGSVNLDFPELNNNSYILKVVIDNEIIVKRVNCLKWNY